MLRSSSGSSSATTKPNTIRLGPQTFNASKEIDAIISLAWFWGWPTVVEEVK